MSSLVSLAASECHVPEEWVDNVLRLGARRVKLLKIPKKNSDKLRTVFRPSAELEILQRWLTLKFFNFLEVHDSAMAFRKDRSILTNAIKHKSSRYFIRVDFKDFFSSIKYSDFLQTLLKSKKCNFLLNDYPDAKNFIERVCFGSLLQLPIGYISSPVISNAVMYEFDISLSKLVQSKMSVLGNAEVTRYADDIVFSTDVKGACNVFLSEFQKFVKNWTSPSLEINEAKTIFSSRAGGSAMVTGLRVCADSHITVTRKYKDEIRLMLSLHSKGKLKIEDFPVLKGHLCYVRHVAPAFFSSLCSKYLGFIDEFL